MQLLAVHGQRLDTLLAVTWDDLNTLLANSETEVAEVGTRMSPWVGASFITLHVALVTNVLEFSIVLNERRSDDVEDRAGNSMDFIALTTESDEFWITDNTAVWQCAVLVVAQLLS